MALEARGLRKRFGETAALDGFDLRIAAGSIQGLLGPNGAGKSTAVRALATLTRLDGGEATIAGHDLRTSPRAVRRSIGLVGQQAAVDEIISGRDNLVMFARLFGMPTRAARARAAELLAEFSLDDAADRPASGYSGGMRRRLDIACGLLMRPSVLFLDEPTTGLDPRGRNEVWTAVRRIAAQGTAVLLTTQYLEEADQLADRIAVMDRGRIIAEDRPEALKRRLGADRIVLTLPTEQLDAAIDAITAAIGAPEVDRETGEVTVEALDSTRSLVATVRALDERGLHPDDVTLRRPTLDEVFLALTERSTR